MSVEVQAVHQVTEELVDAAGRLLPQLSKSAAPFGVNDLARIISHQATTLFIARSQDVIVGMLTLVTFPLPSGFRARIEDVVVDQNARGQGVGTALTMAAVDLAQQQGARSIDLTSRASRVGANRLYQRLGFRLRDSNVYRYQPNSQLPSDTPIIVSSAGGAGRRLPAGPEVPPGGRCHEQHDDADADG